MARQPKFTQLVWDGTATNMQIVLADIVEMFWEEARISDKILAALGSSGTLDHGFLAGLADDDHTQYILVTGTRAFTGNQSMGSNKLTNLAAATTAGDAIRFEQGNKFETIVAPAGTNPVADSLTDTLTFANGANISITGDAATDTLTIAATGVATLSFTTFDCSSGTDPVADSASDTLQMTGGEYITVTGDSAADSITFAMTGFPVCFMWGGDSAGVTLPATAGAWNNVTLNNFAPPIFSAIQGGFFTGIATMQHRFTARAERTAGATDVFFRIQDVTNTQTLFQTGAVTALAWYADTTAGTLPTGDALCALQYQTGDMATTTTFYGFSWFAIP